MPKDFYDLFDIDKDSSETEVTNAYRRLVKKYHPDKCEASDAQDKFKTIQKGYTILTNKKEKKFYDKLGHRDYVDLHIREELKGFRFTAKSQSIDEEKEKQDYNKHKNTLNEEGSYNRNRKNTTTRVENPEKVPEGSVESVGEPEYKQSNKRSIPKRNWKSSKLSKKTWKENKKITKESKKENYTRHNTNELKSENSKESQTEGKKNKNIQTINNTEKNNSDIIFKPKIQKNVVFSVLTVFFILGIYMYAIIEIAETRINSFWELFTNPELIVEVHISGEKTIEALELVTSGPFSDIYSLIFVIAIIVFPLTLALIIWKIGGGQKILWVYAVAATIPLVALVLSFVAGFIIPSHLSLFVYLGLPLIISVVFTFDILAYIVKQYLNYYIKKYNI